MKTFTTIYSSTLGPIVIESDGQAITSLRFSKEQASAVPKEAPKEAVPTPPIIAETIQWLDDYFAGKRPCNVPRLNPRGTAFQKRVWTALKGVALPGRWFLRAWNLLEPTTAKSSPFVPTPVPFSLAPTNTGYNLYQVLIAQFNELRQIGFSIYHSANHFY